MIISVTGIMIILIGEIEYRFKPSDERIELEKAQYYNKAFLVFINVAACAYCIKMALYCRWWKGYDYFDTLYQCFIKDKVIYINANNAMGILLGPCWIYLLLQFKIQNLPLNSSVIDAGSGEYWKKVFLNILKFAAVCALYTVISLFITLVYESDISNIGGSDILQLKTIVTFITNGLAIFAGFSIEYLIYSLMERRSEIAKAENKVTKLVMVFFILGLSAIIINRAFTGFNNLNVNLILIVKAIKSNAELYGFIGLGLCIVYAISELRERLSDEIFNRVKQLGFMLIAIRICSLFFFNIITRGLFIYFGQQNREEAFMSLISYSYPLAYLVLAILKYVVILRLFLQLKKEGLVKNVLLPIVAAIAYIVYDVVVVYYAHSETMLAFTLISCLTEALYVIPFIRIFRRFNNQPEMASMDN